MGDVERLSPFAAMVEHLAALLAFAQRRKGSETVPLDLLDGARPYTEHYIRVMGDLGVDVDEESFIPADAEPTDLTGPPRHCIAADCYEPNTRNNTAYMPIAVRPSTWKDMKGQRLPFVSRFHCLLTFGMLHYDGTYEMCRRIVSWNGREKKWLMWGHGRAATYEAGIDQRMRIVIGSQFAARYDWHALIGIGMGPRVAIPCTAKQAQKLFAARDLPPGRARRTALLHWVGEHYRARNAESLVHVRPHLRGAAEFDWERLHVEVRASEYDRDQLTRAASEPAPAAGPSQTSPAPPAR